MQFTQVYSELDLVQVASCFDMFPVSWVWFSYRIWASQHFVSLCLISLFGGLLLPLTLYPFVDLNMLAFIGYLLFLAGDYGVTGPYTRGA